jgi:hypothetical protein
MITLTLVRLAESNYLLGVGRNKRSVSGEGFHDFDKLSAQKRYAYSCLLFREETILTRNQTLKIPS